MRAGNTGHVAGRGAIACCGVGRLRTVAWSAHVIALAAAAMLASPASAAEEAVGARIVVRPGSATLESALIQAYHNNPQLNAQRAATRAVDENVPVRAVRLSPAGDGNREPYRAVSGHPHQDHRTRRQRLHQDARRRSRVGSRPHRNPEPSQRLSDREPHAPGRGSGVLRARGAALDRAVGAAQCRDRLHECAARRRDPGASAQQRERARGHAAADPRPLQCRRGDAHRRRASRIRAWLPAARNWPSPNPISSPRGRNIGR